MHKRTRSEDCRDGQALRIELSGALYHVTSRSDGREDIYFADADRQAWVELCGQVCERFNWVCHAWCQMTNHYHVVVETPEANLAQGMRQLNGVYTQHVNHARRRSGHVFQGRQTAMALAYLSGDHTMKAIAGHFGVHCSTVSLAVSAHESTVASN